MTAWWVLADDKGIPPPPWKACQCKVLPVPVPAFTATAERALLAADCLPAAE